MRLDYEGTSYEFDLQEITLAQATYIFKHLGLTLMGLDQGMAEGHPDALRAIWWLIQTQSGNKVNIDNVDFKIVKLSNAIQEATERENEEKGLNPDGSPKDPEDQTLTPSDSSEETPGD